MFKYSFVIGCDLLYKLYSRCCTFYLVVFFAFTRRAAALQLYLTICGVTLIYNVFRKESASEARSEGVISSCSPPTLCIRFQFWLNCSSFSMLRLFLFLRIVSDIRKILANLEVCIKIY